MEELRKYRHSTERHEPAISNTDKKTNKIMGVARAALQDSHILSQSRPKRVPTYLHLPTCSTLFV